MLLLSAKKLRYINHHKTPAKNLCLSGAGTSLDQVKCTNKNLPAIVITEHWLKQPKMLPSHMVVECQKMKMHQQLQNS